MEGPVTFQLNFLVMKTRGPRLFHPRKSLVLIGLAFAISAFIDTFWHARYFIRNETDHTLEVGSIARFKTACDSCSRIDVPPHSKRMINLDHRLVLYAPREFFEEITLRKKNAKGSSLFCRYTSENFPAWEEVFSFFEIEYVLVIRPENEVPVVPSVKTIAVPGVP